MKNPTITALALAAGTRTAVAVVAFRLNATPALRRPPCPRQPRALRPAAATADGPAPEVF